MLIDRQPLTTNAQPRAALREPPSQLPRASTIFITKSDGHTEELRRRIAELNPTAGIIECVHHPLYLEDVFTGERRELHFLKGRKVASFSGIAQPESFEQSLVKLGSELVYSKRFADQCCFTQQEVLNAINRSKRQAQTIITTQKMPCALKLTARSRHLFHALRNSDRERREDFQVASAAFVSLVWTRCSIGLAARSPAHCNCCR